MLPWVHSTEHGTIYGWTGNPLFVPDGFVVCNGQNSTPDLRDRFVPGALNVYSVGEKNGVSVHVHSFTSDNHPHNLGAGTEIPNASAPFDNFTDPKPATGTTFGGPTEPPYYALIFLMKL